MERIIKQNNINIMTEQELKLEERKVKALEKIANSVDALTIWFEDIDKQDWSDRMQFYLHEWHKTIKPEDA
jgi:hypothetical protein